MKLGAFSVSLAVKDIEKSKNFYEKLGFTIFGGDQSQNWLIMKNGDHVIGLFQGMFESNILTFNPGWDQDCNTMESFTDVREIHEKLKSQGIEVVQESINGESGPSSFAVVDPDGNSILIDQHV
ncbi:VOC family protein [Aliikangiella coralliicola]|uniref:VOC family protein n=1 Tax=Aliikangiella coralliicola TaxID=2592383 RepID=A0A545UFK8_9GAMM|nr:VOC family protein [Aliikangiella coralliicola]TQV88173.1 VOC family protein [Aliikangiella coralliicola]